MTKKKACKKGCVDCDECLIKQKIKKQKLAKAKAILNPKIKKQVQPNFDWAKALPPPQFVQKQRIEKVITLADLQNEIQKALHQRPQLNQLNQDVAPKAKVEVQEVKPQLREKVGDYFFYKEGEERPEDEPMGKWSDPIDKEHPFVKASNFVFDNENTLVDEEPEGEHPLVGFGKKLYAGFNSLFGDLELKEPIEEQEDDGETKEELPENERGETKEEDDDESEFFETEEPNDPLPPAEVPLLQIGEADLERGLSPPHRQETGFGGATPDFEAIPLTELSLSSDEYSQALNEPNIDEAEFDFEEEEELPPTFARPSEPNIEDAEFDFEESPNFPQAFARPPIPTLQAQLDYEDENDNDPLKYEPEEEFNFSPEDIASSKAMLTGYKKAEAENDPAIFKPLKEMDEDEFYRLAQKAGGGDMIFVKPEPLVFGGAEDLTPDAKVKKAQSKISQLKQNFNEDLQKESKEVKRGRPVGAKSSTTIAREAREAKDQTTLERYIPTEANTEPPAVFIPAAEATFIQPMMTRSKSSLEKG